MSVGFGSTFQGDLDAGDSASVAPDPRMARLRGMHGAQGSSRSVLSAASAGSASSRGSKPSSRKGRRKGNKKGPGYLETHYTVVVVSELFENKTLQEQLNMVYRVLHQVRTPLTYPGLRDNPRARGCPHLCVCCSWLLCSNCGCRCLMTRQWSGIRSGGATACVSPVVNPTRAGPACSPAYRCCGCASCIVRPLPVCVASRRSASASETCPSGRGIHGTYSCSARRPRSGLLTAPPRSGTAPAVSRLRLHPRQGAAWCRGRCRHNARR